MQRLFDTDRRTTFRLLVENAFDNLSIMKEQNDQKGFNQLLKPILPGVRRYIARRLANAVRNGHLPSGKYQVEDLLNELYVLAYDKFHEVEKKENLRWWLIQKADELLKDISTTEEFDKYFFDNIDKYVKAEWDEMQEEFNVGADDDLMMQEELDNPFYPKYNYTLEDVLVEDQEWDLIERLNNELSNDEIHQQIDMVLHQLPLPMRTVFNLAINHEFQPDEIARIQMISVEEVEKYLSKTRRSIRVSFEKRFL